MQCTCKGCQDRKVGCHARCEIYQKYSEERAQISKARRAEQNKDFLEIQRHREFKDIMISKMKRGRK